MKDDIAKKYKNLCDAFKSESLGTWFDMGLFLDGIKDNRKSAGFSETFSDFKKQMARGIGFVTFDYGIDGVTIEIVKYCRSFEKMFADEFGIKPKIHFLGGKFFKESEIILESRWNKIERPEIWGFDEWDGYHEYFHTNLQRGSKEYNVLASKLLKSTEKIATILGKLVVDNDIQILIPVNVTSNPGNVALAFAMAIVSEYMDIPVIGNHHDFYWESGKRKRDRAPAEKQGIRDHFFENSHLGEVFSMIEMLYPWEGERWTNMVINDEQRKTLINKFGFNPVSIRTIPTSIDMKKYRLYDEDEKKNILKRLELIFSGGAEKLYAFDAHKLDDSNSEERGHTGEPIILGNGENIRVRLGKGNLFFLQPTRIIRRKRIELNFKIINELLTKTQFGRFFEENSEMTITLLITGPIANQHGPYFRDLVKWYKEFIGNLPEWASDRIFMACPFGLENKKILRERKLSELSIHEIYAISSITTLLSETEGRGLPIIEAAASCIPIVCHRYHPEHVYRDVVGENKEESKRLKVFDFKGNEFPEKMLNEVADYFINPEAMKNVSEKNLQVVERRFGQKNLIRSFDKALYSLWERSSDDGSIAKNVRDAFEEHKRITDYGGDFKELVLSEARSYLPGLTITEFMVYLKSLIDPSFFRIEQMEFRGRIMSFCEHLIRVYNREDKFDNDMRKLFYKHIDFIFEYYDGNDEFAIDHTLSYRHRNRRHYPYRKVTEQELMGVIGIIYRKIIPKRLVPIHKDRGLWQMPTLKSGIMQILGTTGEKLAINDIDRLIIDLRSGKDFAYFPGKYFRNEVNILVLSVLKERLGLSQDDTITKEILTVDKIEKTGKVTFFVRKERLNDVDYEYFVKWIKEKACEEVRLLFKEGLFRIVPTEMLSVGPHLGQLGADAQKELICIKQNSGFIIFRGNNSFMLDMVDMASYRFGRIKDSLMSNFMDIKIGDAYIQWVPAGMKPSLAYPTPVQTPKEFSDVLKSDLYKKVVRKFGEYYVLDELRKDADRFGNPIKEVLTKMFDDEVGQENKEHVSATKINGIHGDGLPWSGGYVKVKTDKVNWKFETAFAGPAGQTVFSLISDFEKQTNKKVKFAWNGGYILNAELVGKLGLPEDYIGSPLGLVCSGGKIKALPLYNKATFLIDNDGRIKLERVNLNKGFTLKTGKQEIELGSDNHNKTSSSGPIYYDLLWKGKTIPAKDRIVYRLVGNRVIEIISGESDVKVIPVGIILSFPANEDLKGVSVGDEFEFVLHEYPDLCDAIEAGPMQVRDGEVDIDMEIEGWTTQNSIRTQAARLDYTDMRGPKIGVGITKEGDLILIAINGRIRESVGATHMDIANILKNYGAREAMGFDPGGSVTIVVDGVQQNISPYNKNYEENVFSLPPEPRMVGNAVLGIEST
ncbi:MAG: phosphodiester glycosidase family protein [Bacteriovoracaceae bacterium]|nr:phosphodiester glycosidase family protein [Bacteriovoracaceae bacterium]